MSAGREFHVCGAATENARRASSVRTLGTPHKIYYGGRGRAHGERLLCGGCAPAGHIRSAASIFMILALYKFVCMHNPTCVPHVDFVELSEDVTN